MFGLMRQVSKMCVLLGTMAPFFPECLAAVGGWTRAGLNAMNKEISCNSKRASGVWSQRSGDCDSVPVTLDGGNDPPWRLHKAVLAFLVVSCIFLAMCHRYTFFLGALGG